MVEDNYETVEQLAPGFRTYQRKDGIFVYIFSDMSRQTVDVAFARIDENDRIAHAAQKHIRCIYDIRGHWVISPYLIKTSIESASQTPKDLVESMAVVGNQLTLKILGGVIRRLTPKAQQNLRVFSSEADAVQWLDERVKQLGVPPYV